MSHGHKVAALVFTVALALAGMIGLLWLLGGSTPSVHADSPHYVAPDCTGIPAPCHITIQEAVDAASPGDVIQVATGVYTDVHGLLAPPGYPNPPTSGIITQVVYISKTVTIRGGYTTTNWTTPYPITQPTTLDAQGQGRVIFITSDISPTIEGLHITGGDATGLGGGGYWGGDVGGGVHIISATATISNNWVFSNTAYRGGGLFLSSDSVTLSNNTVISNIADFGGGLYLAESDATLSGNTVISNTAVDVGGGLVVVGNATLSGNIIISNIANLGGGLILAYTAVTLTNNVVADNRASTAGSGLYIYGASPRLLHTTIARNGSAGLIADSGGDSSGVYITDAGYDVYSTVALTNTILVSHSVGISVTGGNTVTVNSILWYSTPVTVSQATTATVAVQNQYPGDPLFATDGYHLMEGSAAIDKGVDAGVMTDIGGDSRDSAPDLGADEFVSEPGKLYLPIILKTQAPDFDRSLPVWGSRAGGCQNEGGESCLTDIRLPL
jgi:hypothetical protein